MAYQYISPKEDFAKSLCNEAYYWVQDRLLQIGARVPFLEKPCLWLAHHDVDLAAILGLTVGGYGTASAGALLVNHLNVPETLGSSFTLENLAAGSLMGVALSSGETVIRHYDEVKNWIEENPRYSAGVAGVLTGASLKAMVVLSYL